MVTQLYPYQRLALYHLRRGLEAGIWRQYVDLPTGTGKSTIAAAFAAQRLARGRVLALVHCQDLALQLAQTLRREDLEVGLVMEGSRVLDTPVVVTTVQSLTPEVTQDLLAANPIPILTVLIDEAHHAVSDSSYERVLVDIEHAAGAQPVATVGWTATPYRTDERSMLDLLPVCVFARTIPEMVQEGYLAPLTWQPVQVNLDLHQIATTRKSGELDYAETTLARHLLHEAITARIVQHAASRIGQRPTLVFAASVQHAQQLTAAFRARVRGGHRFGTHEQEAAGRHLCQLAQWRHPGGLQLRPAHRRVRLSRRGGLGRRPAHTLARTLRANAGPGHAHDPEED
jgi:ATP-dependent helicase IRC3